MNRLKTFALLLCLSLSLLLPATTLGSLIIWEEDFSGATLGGTSGVNQNLAGTVIQTGNGSTSRVVDATTEAGVAAAFTKASGNFICLSSGTGGFDAVRSQSTLSFAALDDTALVSFSVDIYIPNDVAVALPRIQPRLEQNGTPGNGPDFTSQNVTAAGEYTISYNGTVATFKNAAGAAADTARPFIFMNQNAIATDFLYMDNISFVVTPEPSSFAMVAIGGLFLARRKK